MNTSARLPSRMLGASGIAVSAIGLGCMSLSGVYGASSDDDGVALIGDALDRGITLLDTSDAYGAGHNETIVGKAIKGRRGEVVLATKFGNVGGRGGKFADGRPGFVIASCEASLKRLGFEVIDLVLPAPHRSRCADRRYGRRDGAAGAARQGTRARLKRSSPKNNPPGAGGASDRGGAERVLAAVPDQGGGDAAYHARAWSELRRLFAARPRAVDRRRRRSEHNGGNRCAAAASALCRREHRRQSGAGRSHQGDRGTERLHAGPAGSGLAARARRRYRADPGDEAPGAALRGCRGAVGVCE